MYFDSYIKGKQGLFDSRSKWDKSSDSYFESLEELAEEIDDIESNTSFISELTPDDFGNGYQFIIHRIRELKDYLIDDETIIDTHDLLESLDEIREKLDDLKDDALLYDDISGYDDEDDDDDWEYSDLGLDDDEDFDDDSDW